MVRCPDCGADGRVALVNEHAARGVEITYLCPNRRCMHYLQDIGMETLGPARGADDTNDTDDAQGTACEAAG